MIGEAAQFDHPGIPALRRATEHDLPPACRERMGTAAHENDGRAIAVGCGTVLRVADRYFAVGAVELTGFARRHGARGPTARGNNGEGESVAFIPSFDIDRL